jgi:site-specific recombinase XerD
MKDHSTSSTVEHWYQRTIESLLISGKTPKTAATYAREIRIMGRWLEGKPLDEATQEDLRRFYIHRLQVDGLKGSSLRILICGVRELFQTVLGHDWPVLKQLWAKRTNPIPVVLEREEAWRLIDYVPSTCHKAYFTLIYTCGLRMSEGLNLTIHNIKGKREPRVVIVRNGKGEKDRIVPLPEATYLLLREYWASHRNPKWIFPAPGRGGNKAPTATEAMTGNTVQGALRRYSEKAGIYRPGVRIHTLRHCYATHLLEAGVNVHAIQKYLGHENLTTTLLYFHLTRMGQVDNEAIIESIMTMPKEKNNA